MLYGISVFLWNTFLIYEIACVSPLFSWPSKTENCFFCFFKDHIHANFTSTTVGSIEQAALHYYLHDTPVIRLTPGWITPHIIFYSLKLMQRWLQLLSGCYHLQLWSLNRACLAVYATCAWLRHTPLLGVLLHGHVAGRHYRSDLNELERT